MKHVGVSEKGRVRDKQTDRQRQSEEKDRK